MHAPPNSNIAWCKRQASELLYFFLSSVGAIFTFLDRRSCLTRFHGTEVPLQLCASLCEGSHSEPASTPRCKEIAATIATKPVQRSLRKSSNADMKSLWKMTSSLSSNIIRDSKLLKNSSLDGATKAIKLEAVNQAVGHVKTLTIQGMAISSIVNSMKPSQITAWTAEVNKLQRHYSI